MNTLDFVTVPIILAVVYLAIGLLKKETGSSERLLRRLPLIAAVLGAVLGAILFYAAPDIMPASNTFVAVLIGGASGLAATGTNQLFKQMSKKDGENNGGDDKTN